MEKSGCLSRQVNPREKGNKAMNTDKLKYAVTLAKTKSLSKAAAELFMTQPALTKSINKLEEELGTKLFNRTTIPISMTYAGEYFVTRAEKILEMQNDLAKQMEDISHAKKGRLTIGMTASRSEGYLPFVLPAFRKAYPNIELKVLEGDYSYLEAQLENQMADLLLMAMPINLKSFEYQLLMEEEVFLVMSEKNPLVKGLDLSHNSVANPLILSPEQLDGVPMTAMIRGSGMRRIIDDILDSYNIHCPITMETASVDAAYKMAAANIGVAFIPRSIITTNFPKWLPIICRIGHTPVTRKNVICYRKGSHLTQNEQDFIQLMRSLVQGNCPKFRIPSQEEFEYVRGHMETMADLQYWLNHMQE